MRIKGVYIGKPREETGARWVEIIKDFEPAPQLKKYSLCNDPYMITKIDNSMEVYDKTQIVIINIKYIHKYFTDKIIKVGLDGIETIETI